jgi:hypothetical protein
MLTAQVPAADLLTPGMALVSVTDSGVSSVSPPFVISPTTLQVTAVNVVANDLVWDPIYQRIYLSVPNSNTVQVLDPETGTLGASASVGSQPDLLAVSRSSQYLYVGIDGGSSVQRLTLPSLGTDISIPLENTQAPGPFYAMDLQAAPSSDHTIGVILGEPGYGGLALGGVLIFDDSTARPNFLCGENQRNCQSANSDYWYNSMQWNSDGSELFMADTEGGGDLYTFPITSAGFGAGTDYPGALQAAGAIHYDTTTGYVYDDNGEVLNPANGKVVGTFNTTGPVMSNVSYWANVMVPDGSVGLAFFLRQTDVNIGGNVTRYATIESFDLNTFTPLGTLIIPNVNALPTHLIRWGTSGLAFTASIANGNSVSGAVYIINSSFVTDKQSRSLAARYR